MGADFTYYGNRAGAYFWTDLRRIYAKIEGTNGELIAQPGVKASEFRNHGDQFGMDGKSVFYGSDQLPLRADQLKTQWSFAWDDERVFWGDFEAPLHGASFRILGPKGDRLHIADANQTLLLGRDIRSRPTRLRVEGWRVERLKGG